MALTKAANRKRRSGRRIAADLLNDTRCDSCGSHAAVISVAKQRKNGTKWIHICVPCMEEKGG